MPTHPTAWAPWRALQTLPVASTGVSMQCGCQGKTRSEAPLLNVTACSMTRLMESGKRCGYCACGQAECIHQAAKRLLRSHLSRDIAGRAGAACCATRAAASGVAPCLHHLLGAALDRPLRQTGALTCEHTRRVRTPLLHLSTCAADSCCSTASLEGQQGSRSLWRSGTAP